ncbi:kynurenine formamidase isoform X2 [Dendropsophus ebraccatus]|uniref:kynurenine formamidase isoform X2 n=1 Tax=Dendropsophus ebraccatus TaxID=150705 RepID=UPI0038311146
MQRDIQVTDMQRDIQVTDPQRDIQVTDMQRDIQVTDPQRDIQVTDPQRDIQVTDMQRDIQVTDMQRDIQVTGPQGDIQVTDPQRDIQELEHQYSPSHWSHRMDKDVVIEAHVRETAEGTRKSQAVARTAMNIQYGDSDSERMDLYLPDGEQTKFPILVYIHGGYWQFLSKEESGFMAAPLVSNGIAVMAMDYDIAPKGTMDVMVAQVRRSIAKVYRLYPQNTEVALKNSPIQHVRRMSPLTCPMVIVVAEHDSPEFQRQSQLYFQSLTDSGLRVSYVQVDGTDHFDVIERLGQEDYVLTQLILKMILDN